MSIRYAPKGRAPPKGAYSRLFVYKYRTNPSFRCCRHMACTTTALFGNNAAIQRIEKKLDTITTDLASVKIDVAALKTDVAALKTDVSGLKTDVSGLKIDVAALKSSVMSSVAYSSYFCVCRFTECCWIFR